MHLEHDTTLAVCWFESNYMKLTTDKYHFIISGNKHESLWTGIGNDRKWESNNVKLLGVNIGSDWEFNEHMLNICSKANRKPIVSGIFKYLTFEKKKIFLRTYFESQCKYYPLV